CTPLHRPMFRYAGKDVGQPVSVGVQDQTTIKNLNKNEDLLSIVKDSEPKKRASKGRDDLTWQDRGRNCRAYRVGGIPICANDDFTALPGSTAGVALLIPSQRTADVLSLRRFHLRADYLVALSLCSSLTHGLHARWHGLTPEPGFVFRSW